MEILGASMGEIPHMAFFLLGVCCFLFSAYGLCFTLLDFSRLFCTFFLLNIVTGSSHVGVRKNKKPSTMLDEGILYLILRGWIQTSRSLMH